MTCFYPLPYKVVGFNSFTNKNVQVVLPRTDVNLSSTSLRLPCGKCSGCRLKRSRMWAIRCVHEMQFHSHSSFITLTFRPEDCPSDMCLDVTVFQKFMKRLRKHLSGESIRFFHCGEYGPKLGRPHYHAIIFGYDFPDKVFWQKSASGEKLYRSAVLEKLWPFGYSTVGEANYNSAAYVARYIMKKVSGDLADDHYTSVDLDSGEVIYRKPEYTTMSRRPGIGKFWFDKFKDDIYPFDEVLMKTKAGVRAFKPPSFYDGLYEVLDPEGFERIKVARKAAADLRKGDNSPERLEVRRKCLEAKLVRLPRNLVKEI